MLQQPPATHRGVKDSSLAGLMVAPSPESPGAALKPLVVAMAVCAGARWVVNGASFRSDNQTRTTPLAL